MMLSQSGEGSVTRWTRTKFIFASMFEFLMGHELFYFPCHSLDVVHDQLIKIRILVRIVYNKFGSHCLTSRISIWLYYICKRLNSLIS